MKTFALLAASLTFLVAAALAAEPMPPGGNAPAAPAQSSTDSPLKTDKDKISYAIGLNIGRSMKKQGLDVDTKTIGRGLADGFSGESLLTDQEIEAIMMSFQQAMMAKMGKQADEVSAKNAKDGAAFLAENGKKPGIVTLPSGLQYKEVKAGTGATPKSTDQVVAHYEGKLLDGTVFDSSMQRGKPETFPVTGVIAGWQEALQLMKVGAKWQLFIPAKLAYGEQGAGDDIPPNATLIFDIELISVK